ncbi:MAG: serine/threonine protein kinase [Lachnospiraceae bacterium]|nr:serine/threonine protein kinase [Lachnospiraceae bacterium]
MNERSVDQYEILRELGRGGTSVVYLVKDKADRRNYAMKVLRNDDGKQELSEKKADHLSAEAEVLKALCIDEPGNVSLHPGIPAYIECVCDGKGEFAGFVMEYVEGRSLQKILEDGRAYTVREAVEAGLQLCGIMEQLHGQNPPMIFRDLKPANILVRPSGEFVLVDYGAVRKLRKSAGSDTMQLGTDGYAAPEQYGGWEQSDERTDIYGIGAVLHHMITGRPPLDTGLRPLREILGAEGESRQLDEMAKILLRCCMTAPSMRYSSCKELEKALRSVIRLRTRSRSRERGWKWFVLLVNTAAVCLGLAIVLAASAAGAKTAEYCALIEKARKETDFEEKKEAYRRAAALRPEDQEAYICFLRELVADCVITEEEKSALDDVLFGQANAGRLWEKAAGNEEGNLERMRKKRPGDYAAFSVELGKAYFACYEGGREAARLCFRNALSAAGLWFDDRDMAEAMEVVLGEEWSKGRIDAWRELEETSTREAEMSGNGVFAAAVCKAAAAEIALSADRHREVGTDMEMAKEVVQVAEIFMENAENDRIYVPERLREEMRTAVRSAERAVSNWAK